MFEFVESTQSGCPTTTSTNLGFLAATATAAGRIDGDHAKAEQELLDQQFASGVAPELRGDGSPSLRDLPSPELPPMESFVFDESPLTESGSGDSSDDEGAVFIQ